MHLLTLLSLLSYIVRSHGHRSNDLIIILGRWREVSTYLSLASFSLLSGHFSETPPTELRPQPTATPLYKLALLCFDRFLFFFIVCSLFYCSHGQR